MTGLWTLLKRFFTQPQEDNRVKNFDEETADLHDVEYRKQGIISIAVDKITGSVGRAHELDTNFRYRGRSKTERYHNINQRVRQGQPMDPIKVLKVKRDRQESEYYVVDGHHRVADAKSHGYDQINAQVTDVTSLPDDESDET